MKQRKKQEIQRRTFLQIVGASALFPTEVFSAEEGRNEERRKVLWSGMQIMQTCRKGSNCSVENEFPRVLELFKDESFVPVANTNLRGPVGRRFGKPQNLTMLGTENLAAENNKEKLRFSLILGIAADTKFGSLYSRDETFTLYGIQTYLMLFDVEKYEVLQCIPIRIKSLRRDRGDLRKTDKTIIKELRTHLGGAPAEPELKNIWLPTLVAEKLNSLSFRPGKPLNLRVTDVTLSKSVENWVAGQKKNTDLYAGFIGHSLTSSIAETFRVGIQPHASSYATTTILTSFTVSGSDSTLIYQKSLNNIGIDLELRVRVISVSSKKIKEQRYDGQILKSEDTLIFSIEAGRWKRKYSDKENQILEKIEKTQGIFKQIIAVKVSELIAEELRNDWQLVLDLQQYAFDWFCRLLFAEKYQELATGEIKRGSQKVTSIRVYTKQVDVLIAESKRLRSALLGT